MKLTEQAIEYLKDALQANNATTLRFYGVSGCCGVQLGAAFEEAEEADHIETINGVKIAFDPIAKEELDGVTIDIEERDGQMGFVLDGYQPTSSCGCGAH